MSVAVVTPWRDHLELWDDYGQAIAIGPMPDELIIIDDGSDPELDFTIIRNPEPLGFSAASNQGLRIAEAETVLFLNNDIAATEHGWLQELADQVEPGVLVGQRIRSDVHSMVEGRVYPYLDGWCLAGIREELLDLGGFDESLEEPAYFSDNLLCLEARHQGFTLREVPVGLIHKGGQTTRPADNHAAQSATLNNQRRYQQRVRALAQERMSSV